MKSLLLLFIGLVLFSCSIQKRHHLPGYRISFHKHYKSNYNEIEKKQLSISDEIELVSEETLKEQETKPLTSSYNDEIISNEINEEKKLEKQKIDHPPLLKYEKKISKFNLKKTNEQKSSKKIQQKEKNQSEAFNIFAILGFSFGILASIFVISFGFPFLMAAAAIVLSSIAIHQIRNGKGKSRGKGLAIAGLILGILSMLIFWAILIIFILFLSFYW